MSRHFIFSLLTLSCLCLHGGETILDGTSSVKLEIETPIEAEKTAEAELKTYIKRIFAGHPGKSASHARFILRHDPELDDAE